MKLIIIFFFPANALRIAFSLWVKDCGNMDIHLSLLQIVITRNIQNIPINSQIISVRILEDSKEPRTRYKSKCAFKYFLKICLTS